MAAPIQWVVFDLGGVLVRICSRWQQAADRAKLTNFMDVDDPAVKAAIGRALHNYETNAVTSDELLRQLSKLSNGHSVDDIRAIIDAWLIEPYPGVGELIDDLNAAGLHTACLSNTNDLHWRQMLGHPRFAVLTKLHQTLASHLIAARKPDTAIYQHLETVTGAAPRSIVFFDDLPANIDAAVARGWRGQLIDPAGDTAAQMRRHLREWGLL